MPIDPRRSRLVAAALAPVLLVQGRRVRRVIPRLADAAFPWHGSLDGPVDPAAAPPVRILVLGDSTAAGVGADTQDNALPGNIARAVRDHWGAGSTWNAFGANGATARDIVEQYLAAASAASYDFIFLSIGANDALTLRSRRAFARDVRTILRRLRVVSPSALILMSSLPAFFRFEALPQPLRWALYLHSTSLENAARAVVAGEPGVLMSPPPPPYTPGFFASDRFHPSASGYRDWVEFALEDAGLVVPAATATAAATAPAATAEGLVS